MLVEKGVDMPDAPVIVRKKQAPVVIRKEEKSPKPLPPKGEPPERKQPQRSEEPKEKTPDLRQDKPKGPAPVDKVSQHLDYLTEIESMSLPEREIARACYFLCFLINENRTTTTLFPIKDKILESLFKSGHICLMMSYVRRGDRLTYRLTQEAKEKWESETGGKKDLIHLYRTPGCYVQSERGYYNLYQFHVVVEPFRFLFHMPVDLGSWVAEERLLKPRLHTNHMTEYGLLRGQAIKISRKSINATDEQIGQELQRFLDTPLPNISSEREDVTEGSVQAASPWGCK